MGMKCLLFTTVCYEHNTFKKKIFLLLVFPVIFSFLNFQPHLRKEFKPQLWLRQHRHALLWYKKKLPNHTALQPKGTFLSFSSSEPSPWLFAFYRQGNNHLRPSNSWKYQPENWVTFQGHSLPTKLLTTGSIHPVIFGTKFPRLHLKQIPTTSY